jgi:transcriptional regulator with XRE-family HTH domain
MDLAGEAEVSTRHISFLENGRSKPSREMLLVLASVLELPLRERNTLLLAAGFAPAYRETDLAAPEMAQVRRTLQLMLDQAEPFGAVVMDSRWNLVMSNQAALRMTMMLARDPAALQALGPPNMMRLLFEPAGLRDSIVNWEEVARAIISRAHREVQLDRDVEQRRIFDEALSCPGVPADFRLVDIVEDPPILIPVHFRRGDFEARVFTTVTTLGTAQDITLQELRVEVFYPADEASERVLRAAGELAV